MYRARKAVDQADLNICRDNAGFLQATECSGSKAVRQRNVVLRSNRAPDILNERIPKTFTVSLFGLDDRLVEGEPVLNLTRKLGERLLGIVGVCFDHLAALPATAPEQIGRHIEVI